MESLRIATLARVKTTCLSNLQQSIQRFAVSFERVRALALHCFTLTHLISQITSSVNVHDNIQVGRQILVNSKQITWIYCFHTYTVAK